MLAFLRKNQIILSSCFCLLVSLYIINAQARGQLKNDPIGPILLWLLRPMQLGTHAVTGWFSNVQQGFGTLSGFKTENERLRHRIQQLEAERNKLLEIEATNRRLQQLLDFRAQLPPGSVTATIIANSASTWFQSCLLDKGSSDGVGKGMAAVTPLGVVGQVISTAARSAKVLLITDPNSGVDVLVQRTRARGIVSGSLEQKTVMKYVKRSEDIQVGDRLITTGLDGVFPKGLMVGTVTKVTKQNLGLFQYIELTPAVFLSQTEEVLVVKGETNQTKNEGSPANKIR
jgi:rod shape-determining protein MreC